MITQSDTEGKRGVADFLTIVVHRVRFPIVENDVQVIQWTVGDRLRKARRIANVTTGEMAEHLGLDRKMLSRYETDRTPIRLAYVRLWADKCGVSMDWILYGDDGANEQGVPPPGGGGTPQGGAGPRSSNSPRINDTFSNSDSSPRAA